VISPIVEKAHKKQSKGNNNMKLIVIAGTNASGKSGLGIELAQKYNTEIVSADSRQVFEGLDLGSGKVTKEEMELVKHHLIDVARPNDFFSLSEYQQRAYKAIDGIHKANKIPFLVGGTGLYINSIVDGYNLNNAKPDFELRKEVEAKSIDELIDIIKTDNPEKIKSMDLNNKRRLERAAEKVLSGDSTERINSPRYDTLVLGVTWPRDILYERIRIRLDKRLEEGMIDEVIKLRKEGATDDFLYKLGLEYRYILMYLRGEFEDYDAFYNKLFMEIRHLAKEQMTWFRKRTDINWIDMQLDPFTDAVRLIDDFLEL